MQLAQMCGRDALDDWRRMDDQREELLGILQDRCTNYAFLARMYREEASADLLQRMLDDLLQAEEAPGDGDITDDGQAMLERFVRGLAGADLKAVESELAAEYAGLFLSAGKHPVYPYESVYTSQEHLVMQKARDEVVAIYRQEGLSRSEALHEPEDHIAIELEFMARLCQKSVEALEAGDRAACVAHLGKQRAFLIQHLLVWAPAFADDVERAAESDLYRGVARLSKDFLAEEQETIAALIDSL